MSKTILFGLLILPVIIYQACGENAFQGSQRDVASEVTHQVPLDHNHPNPENYKSTSSFRPLYSNRLLTYNHFVDIFGTRLENVLVRNLGWASQDFGFAFGLYQYIRLGGAACNSQPNAYYVCNNLPLDLKTAYQVGGNTPREGRRLRMCHISVNNSQTLAFAFNRIEAGTSLTNPPQESIDNYKRLFQLFYRGHPLPQDSFFDHFQFIFDRETDLVEAWKKTILGVCYSPHWQVL